MLYELEAAKSILWHNYYQLLLIIRPKTTITINMWSISVKYIQVNILLVLYTIFMVCHLTNVNVNCSGYILVWLYYCLYIYTFLHDSIFLKFLKSINLFVRNPKINLLWQKIQIKFAKYISSLKYSLLRNIKNQC